MVGSIRPLVMLLHAWPLQGITENGVEVDEIPDVEQELERHQVLASLGRLGLNIAIKCLTLTRSSIVEALETAMIILISTHGLETGYLVFESATNLGGAELISREDLEVIVSKTRRIATRAIFLSACHSEGFGTLFTETLGLDYAMTVAHNDRLSNLASRTFFNQFLECLFARMSFATAADKAIASVETHDAITPERQIFQRQKFVPFSKQLGRSGLLDEKETIDIGNVQDLTESSDIFGIRNKDPPQPLIGRHRFVMELALALLQNKRVLLKQLEPGLGSSLVVNFMCRYLGNRNHFRTIFLRETFASVKLLIENEGDAADNLIVIDTAWGWREDDMAWVFENESRIKSHLLVVDKLISGKGQIRFKTLTLHPLAHRDAERLQSLCLDMMKLPKPIVRNHSGNPKKLLAWIKSLALNDPEHLARLKRVGEGKERWPDALNTIVHACVGGPSIWSKRERRFLENDEVEWLRSLSAEYESTEKFWKVWLRPTLETLSIIEQYWTNRSVMGFVSANRAERRLLAGKEVGTFLFRMSEKRPGTLTLSFVDEGQRLGKTTFIFRPDCTVEMESKTGKVPCSNLFEAVKSLQGLKRVIVGEDEILDKNLAFADVLM